MLMEYFHMLRDKAKKKIQTADHMLTITYPLVKDPKLLIAVLENISEAIDLGITSVLEHERAFKRIPPYSNNFQGKLNMFKQKLAKRFNVDHKNLRLAQEVQEVLKYHKKSPVEFIRKGRFMISDENYNIKSIDYAKIKQFVGLSRNFVNQLYEMTTKNDAMFG